MIAADTVHLALRNLRQAVLRTVLTSLGVAIGIASLVGMVSFGVALQDQVLGNFTRSGLFDSITVTPAMPAARRRQAGPQARFRESIGPSKKATPRTRLDDEALKELSRLDKVREVFPDVRVPVEVALDGSSEFSAVRGVPMSSRNESAFRNLAFGRFFKSESEDACLVSLEFARRLTDREPKGLLGKSITLRYVSGTDLARINPMAMAAGGGLNIQRTEKTFTIVGIADRQSGFNLGMFSAVMIPLPKAQELGAYDISNIQSVLRQMSDKRSYSMATVKVKLPQDTQEVERKIRDMGFNAMSVSDVIENNKRAFILLDLFLGLVGSIALAVASLGIINTMVMSILERTREIGVMKAIGASDRDVRRIFLIEASLIGVIGGVSGIALGWGVGRAINVGVNYYLRSLGEPAANLFMIPVWLMAGAIGFAVLVSLIAGSFPASRAARLDPIQALRHD